MKYLLDPVRTQTKEKMNLVKYCRKWCGDLIVSVENDEDSRSDKGTATNKQLVQLAASLTQLQNWQIEQWGIRHKFAAMYAGARKVTYDWRMLFQQFFTTIDKFQCSNAMQNSSANFKNNYSVTLYNCSYRVNCSCLDMNR